jgi:hypothetical protein
MIEAQNKIADLALSGREWHAKRPNLLITDGLDFGHETPIDG